VAELRRYDVRWGGRWSSKSDRSLLAWRPCRHAGALFRRLSNPSSIRLIASISTSMVTQKRLSRRRVIPESLYFRMRCLVYTVTANFWGSLFTRRLSLPRGGRRHLLPTQLCRKPRAGLAAYTGRTVVGYHGSVFTQPFVSYPRSRKVFTFYQQLTRMRTVDARHGDSDVRHQILSFDVRKWTDVNLLEQIPLEFSHSPRA
jgi:hypothetical protein